MSEPTLTDVPIVAPPRTLGLRATLVALATAVIVLFACLGYRATLTEHEVFAAEPAREMLAGGSVVLQPFAGAFRVKKPPGQSWLIALSMGLTGTQNEFTARLPSALAGLGVALLTGMLGARLASRRLGLIAALMTLTCYGVQQRARLAEADMCLALCVMIAYALLVVPLGGTGIPACDADASRRDEKRTLRALAFWLAIAAGFVIKGPIVLAFVVLPAAIFWLLARIWLKDDVAVASVRRIAFHPVAAGVGAALILAWGVSALVVHPDVLRAWWYELFQRQRTDGPDPFWMYAGFVPLALLPWTPFALAGFERARRALRRPAGLLLALWPVIGVVIVSLNPFKRMHYVLPLLPPLTLLAARGFDLLLSRFVSKQDNVVQRARVERLAIGGWFAVVGLAWIASQVFFEPRRESATGVKPFALQVEQLVPTNEPIYFVGVGEERTAFYLHRRLVQTKLAEADDLDAQLARLQPGIAVYVLCRVPNIAEIAARASVVELVRSSDFRGRGEDVERRALLRVIRTSATTQP